MAKKRCAAINPEKSPSEMMELLIRENAYLTKIAKDRYARIQELEESIEPIKESDLRKREFIQSTKVHIDSLEERMAIVADEINIFLKKMSSTRSMPKPIFLYETLRRWRKLLEIH